MQELAEEIGQRVHMYRKRKDISQEKLAEMIDVSKNHISDIERGVANPTMKVMCGILDALDVTLSEFFSPFGSINADDPVQRILSALYDKNMAQQEIIYKSIVLIEDYDSLK